MDSKHLRALYGAKLAEAKELAKEWQGREEQMPADVAQKIDAKLGEADQLKLRLDQALRIEGGDAYLTAPATQPKAMLGEWRDAGPSEGLPADGTRLFLDAKSGELVAGDKQGEAKIQALKSGAYKDALNAYLRTAAKQGGPRLSPEQQKILQEGIDTSGGFWVTPDFRTNLVKKEATMAAIRPNARAFTTGKDVVSFPKVVYTADDLYTSGVRFGWTAEAPSADIDEATNPVAGRVNIPVHTATAAVIVTRAMLEDGDFDLLGMVQELMTETFVLGEEDSFINGTGAGQPQGILNHPNLAVAHASGGMQVLSGASGALAWGSETTGVLGTEASLPPQYEANAKWFARKATYTAIRALNLTTAGIQWGVGDSYPNAANNYQPVLLGYPIVKSQFMPAIGSSNHPVFFGDMQGYWIADRVGITIDVLRELRALRDEVVLYARKRVGGQLVHDWRLKALKSHNS